MSVTLARVPIPADVKDNSETVTDYAFMGHRAPDRGIRTTGQRDRDILYVDTFGYAHYQWRDVSPSGQRVRFDMMVNRAGRVVHLYVTEYWTRVACAAGEWCHSYAARYLAVTDWNGVTHPAEPWCEEHGDDIRKTIGQQPGHVVRESERLLIGQH